MYEYYQIQKNCINKKTELIIIMRDKKENRNNLIEKYLFSDLITLLNIKIDKLTGPRPIDSMYCNQCEKTEQ